MNAILPDGDADGPGDDEGPDGVVERRLAVADACQHGLRLDKALVQMAPEFSRSHLQQLIATGHVRVDGETATQASRKLRVGQRLELELIPSDESRAYAPQALAIDAVFEDPHLLVLNKPAGLVVHPAPGNWSGTLLNGLLDRYAASAALPRAGIVHRLDKDTSGLMVVGKTLAAVTALSRAIAAREVHREYMALAHGCFSEPRRTVEAPIGRDPVSRVRMAVVAGGRPARTDIAQVACRDGCCAVRCTLHTGRTHQIRVHMAWCGHPLVADSTYRGAAALGMARQALHAAQLRLRHPASGEPLAFCCPPPADFERAWASVVRR